MNDWIKVFTKEVFALKISCHYKDNKVMVKLGHEVNYYTFNSRAEAVSKANKIAYNFSTYNEDTVKRKCIKLLDS